MPIPFLKGSLVALVTPFKSGNVDYAALEALVDFHVREGTSAVCPCGTPGESPTLSHEEHREIVRSVVKFAAGRIRVVAGSGSNSTRETIDLTIHAEKAGADAALVITPYYNKPNFDGLRAHFKLIAAATRIPIILYNVPGRTALNVTPEQVAILAEEARIGAVKEASGNVEQATRIRSLCDVTILSGDDALTLPMMSIGATGVISVAANVAPRKTANLVARALKGDYAGARRLHYELLPLFKACFLETNPIPIKAMMEMAGLCACDLRLPLGPLSKTNREACRGVLASMGLLNKKARRR